MPLNLIHGPPNSGRAGLIRRRFAAALDRDPVLVVPNVDDVFSFERELCEDGAALGGSVMTFGALFRAVATAGGAPPGAELTPAQRLRAVAVAVDARLGRLGPLRRSAARPGFARAFERLLDELQGAGVDPERGRGQRRDAGGLRLPERHRDPLRRLRRGPRPGRPGRLPRDRPRGDRAAAPRRLLLGGAARSSSTGSTT